MQRILFISQSLREEPPHTLFGALKSAGHEVVQTSLNAGGRSRGYGILSEAFSGRPPDLLVADLSMAADCLVLRETRRIIQETWGRDFPLPPTLALFSLRHLVAPDWPAYIDDFLLPPYEASEALARVNQLLFRTRQRNPRENAVIADMVFDFTSKQASHTSGKLLALTPRELELLEFLIIHQGKFFSRDRLLDLVWGVDFEGSERTVDIHIRRLRMKLPPNAAMLLETRRGVGYRLKLWNEGERALHL